MATRTSYEQGFWTEAKIRQLRDGWTAGDSIAKIGERLGTTSNAIVGKAHRLKLSPRPNAIKSATWPTPERIAIMQKGWPDYKSVHDIISELEQVGGPDLPRRKTIIEYIRETLHLHRPRDFHKVMGIRPPSFTGPRPKTAAPKVPKIRKAAPIKQAAPHSKPVADSQQRSQVLRKASTIGWRAPTGIAQSVKPNRCLWRGCANETDDKWCAVHATLIRQPADKIVTKLATWR